MSCDAIERIWTRKRGALGKSLVFGLYARGALVALSDLDDVVIRFRLRTAARSTAVDGTGTLQAYTDEDNDPAIYNVEYLWDDADPDVPGTYLVEVDATDGNGRPVTFPDGGEHFLIRITDDVG